MRIFVSWSGVHSLAIATALKDWLPYLFQGIELFVSSESIRKGKRWREEIGKELEACNFGIVCLTPDNTQAPWLLFESGALSKSVTESSLFTLLTGGLRIGDIVEGPLSNFQHTVFEKEDFFKLVQTINEAHAEGKQNELRLRTVFERFWDDLDKAVSTAVKSESKPEKKRSQEEMLYELLDLTNSIARNIPNLETFAHQLQPSFKLDYLGSPPTNEESLWEIVVERIDTEIAPVKGRFRGTQCTLAKDGTLTVHFPPEALKHTKAIDNPRVKNFILNELSRLGQKVRTIIYTTELPPLRHPNFKLKGFSSWAP